MWMDAHGGLSGYGSALPLPARAGSHPSLPRHSPPGLGGTAHPNNQITARTDAGCHHPPPGDTTGRAGLHTATRHQRCRPSLVTCSQLARTCYEVMGTDMQFCHQIFFCQKRKYIIRRVHYILLAWWLHFISVVAPCMTFILSCSFNEQKTNFQAGYVKLYHRPAIAWANFSKSLTRAPQLVPASPRVTE